MRKSIILVLLLLVLTPFVSTEPSVANAQGWRLFSGKIKEDALKKKQDPDADGEAQQEELPPLFDVSRKDREEEQIPLLPEESSSEQTVPQGETQGHDEPPVQRGVRTPVSEGGMLDFSSALTDDAAELSGDADNIPQTYSETNFAPALPSYRNFPEQKNDARLNDVCFVSPTQGWAVGDRGVVWKTADAGANWVLAETPTDANLFGVSFLDENYGLAVGGRVNPTSHAGQGVVLRTIDGGLTWGEVPTAAFPILRDVKIIDEEYAWIAGDSSDLYPSGLFFSTDTGVEWIRVDGNKRGGWSSALYDPIEQLGVGVTTEGDVQGVDGAQAEQKPLSLGTRRARDVVYDGTTQRAWVVGDQGLTLVSSDFGDNWSQTPGGFPNESQNYFDLSGVVALDGFVGVVGTPGSLFFYSDDGGNVWNAAPTGVNTPLRKAAFIDRNNGWAVGDLGVIVATNDGGRTWKLQRSGGTRVAMLGIFGRAEDVPIEALVQLAGDGGFLTEIALVAREADKEGLAAEIPFVERFNEALVETGASGMTQASLFVLNPAVQRDSIEQILARFDAENDGDGLMRFRERLVRLLRIWRPSLLLTADSLLDDGAGNAVQIPDSLNINTPEGARALVGALAVNSANLDQRPHDPFQELLLRELPGAVRNAADPTVFPEHLTACNLEPWSVKKARALCRGKTQGNLSIDSNYFCVSLGRTIAEIAANARAILSDSKQTRDTTNFQTLFSAVPTKYADKIFFDGLDLPYGCDARRARQSALANSADALASRAGDRRQKLGVVDALTRKSSNKSTSGSILLAQLRENIQGVDPDFAVEYLETVGRRFAEQGALAAAEEAYSLVALEMPDHPQSVEAFTWLVQYYSGTEPKRRAQLRGEVTLNENWNDRLLNAQRLGDTIRDFAPEAYMAPEIRFPLAAAQLKSGDLEGAMNFYMIRSQASEDDVWGARAAAEYWLRAPVSDQRSTEKQFCPLSKFTCGRIFEKPYLDGAFEPSVWDSAQKVDLSTPFQEAPPLREPTLAERSAKMWRQKNKAFSKQIGTNVMFAHDSEYLYLGVTCQKTPGVNYSDQETAPKSDLADALNEASGTGANSEKPSRERDADQTFYDRVELLFDLDGDYATAYKFVFDCRGWLSDSNWNEPKWNPAIFVAKSETSSMWTIEAAIPLAELTDRPPAQGEVWRVAMRRIVPGVGIECWNVENSDSGENAFGLMEFE